MHPNHPNEEIFITEGDWRIAKFSYDTGSYLSIQHHCIAGSRSESPKKGWVGMYYHLKGLKDTCYVCKRVPPPGIQVAFIMLNWDKR